jgi:hypothetical protein
MARVGICSWALIAPAESGPLLARCPRRANSNRSFHLGRSHAYDARVKRQLSRIAKSSRRTPACLLALLVAGACHSTPPPPLPSGLGIVASDTQPTTGELFQQPAWKPGERRVYLRGGTLRLELRVESEADGYRLIDDQSGLETLYAPTLAELGQRKKDAPKLALAFDPADHDLTWPLWVGKHWVCHFVSRAAGRPDAPWVAAYHCDAIEQVTVPAGTYRCLRIWRRARPGVPGEFAERTSVVWYAPELGTFVRRLSDGTLTELLALERAPQ